MGAVNATPLTDTSHEHLIIHIPSVPRPAKTSQDGCWEQTRLPEGQEELSTSKPSLFPNS